MDQELFEQRWDEFLQDKSMSFERAELATHLHNGVLERIAEYFYETGYEDGKEEWYD